MVPGTCMGGSWVAPRPGRVPRTRPPPRNKRGGEEEKNAPQPQRRGARRHAHAAKLLPPYTTYTDRIRLITTTVSLRSLLPYRYDRYYRIATIALLPHRYNHYYLLATDTT